jgi:hypothetical protein
MCRQQAGSEGETVITVVCSAAKSLRCCQWYSMLRKYLKAITTMAV